MHALSNGDFRSMELAITRRSRLINFLNEVKENDIHNYMSSTLALAQGLEALRVIAPKYIEQLLQGFNEEMRKEYAEDKSGNSNGLEVGNKGDLFLKIESKVNTTNSSNLNNTKEEREKQFDITKMKFEKLRENPSSGEQGIYKIDQMKRNFIEKIKNMNIQRDFAKLPPKSPDNPAKSYFDSRDFNEVLEASLLHIKESMKGVKPSEEIQHKLVSLIMSNSDIFKKIVQYNITMDSDFILKMEKSSLDEIITKLEHIVKDYAFHVKINNNQIDPSSECKGKEPSIIIPRKKFVVEPPSPLKFNITSDDNSEYKHDWDPFNITCENNGNITINKQVNRSNIVLI
jgi:hypothetical protein